MERISGMCDRPRDIDVMVQMPGDQMTFFPELVISRRIWPCWSARCVVCIVCEYGSVKMARSRGNMIVSDLARLAEGKKRVI